MTRWDKMLMMSDRTVSERVEDVKWLLIHDPLHVKYALSERWIKSAQDIEEILAYGARHNAEPAVMATLHEYRRKCAQENGDGGADLALSLDPEADGDLEQVWETEQRWDGNLWISRYLGHDTHVEIPEQISGETVAGMYDTLFDDVYAKTHAEAKRNAAIQSIRIPGTVKQIPSWFCSRHPFIRSVELCEGVQTIGRRAFSSMPALRKVVLPASIKSIDDGAFSFCSKLTDLRGLHEGMDIHDEAFRDLGDASIEERVKSLRRSVPWRYLETEALDKRVEDVQRTGQSGRFDRLELLFLSIKNLDEAMLKTLLKRGRARDWYDFKLLLDYAAELDRPAQYRDLLMHYRMIYEAHHEPANPEEFCWAWEVRPDGTARLTSYEGSAHDLVIPDQISGLPVTAISHEALSSQKATTPRLAKLRAKIRSLVIPGTIRFVPAFLDVGDNKHLKSLQFKEGVEEIGQNAFATCEKLEDLTFPASLTKIHEDAFKYCIAIKTVSGLQDTVQMKQDAFRYAPVPTDERGLVVYGNRICNCVKEQQTQTICVSSLQQIHEEVLAEMPPIVYRKTMGPLLPPAIPAEISLGDTVRFGRFPQDISLALKPIVWRCIARDGRTVLLLSEKIIANLSGLLVLSRFGFRLDRWLHTQFVPSAFSKSEQDLLSMNPPIDAVHLLTRDEIDKYLPDPEDRMCEETQYAWCYRAAGSYQSLLRTPSWIVGPGGGNTVKIVDSKSGLFREDDGYRLRTHITYKENIAPFGVRPCISVTVGEDG